MIYEDEAIECPRCGGNCLHHEAVEIFERREDAKTALLVRVKRVGIDENNLMREGDPLVTIDPVSRDTGPSDRRHGLRITFSCEDCDTKPVLLMYQHKGATFARWHITACGATPLLVPLWMGPKPLDELGRPTTEVRCKLPKGHAGDAHHHEDRGFCWDMV